MHDQIADVALRATLHHGESPVLSYRVPPRLRPLVRPGQLVWAPLRRRRVQGVVLGLRPGGAAEPPGLRELDDLADPEAMITPAGLGLARWVAEVYRSPLYEALALLLPPGSAQEAERTWRATAAGLAAELGALPERERAVLYLLRSRGERPESELRQSLRGSDTDLREAYASLLERGLVAPGARLTAPGARPRRERTVSLEAAEADIPAALEALARAPRQRAALEWLAAQPAARGEPGLLARVVNEGAGSDLAALQGLERRGLVRLGSREVRRDPLAGDGVPPDQPPPLTPAQAQVLGAVVAALELPAGRPRPAFLLHGVTGSGKTEIYLRAIARAMRLGRQALVLVPEIALTVQLVRRFAARFPGQIAVLHSRLSMGERYDEWRRLRRGEARVAIGSRSAVFAPLPELGLVIVDEEHELTYKHEGSPRYHARDAALRLAGLAGAVALLGSATPSVESYRAARAGELTLLELSERVGVVVGPDGLPRRTELPLPPVRLIDMRRELQSGNRSIFSRPLQQALAETLERGRQAILFLNRRGVASFILCRDCGEAVACPACSGPLTVHYDEGPDDPPGPPPTVLVCHSCAYRAPVPTFCPSCLSPRVRSFGVGTQRVAEEVGRLFPEARVLRWDKDSVRGKGAHDRMLDTFLRHEADVLVGTQMIAKGLDLPLVSLVGVVAADVGLHLPDFRSGERAFQLMAQVAGRAGRRAGGGQVIIQTYNPEHYALQAVTEHDYRAFYLQEIAYRRETGYPPFGRLVRFVYASGSEATCQREAEALARRLQELIESWNLAGWGLVGPAPAYIHRVRGRWRWHVILRAPGGERPEVAPLLAALEPLYGWVVDVDPANVL